MPPEAQADGIAPGFYDQPAIYDTLHRAGTAAEVGGLARVCRRLGLAAAGPWLEPACGTGRYLRALVARGVPVAGFDRSEAMVAYARRLLTRGDPTGGRWRLGVADMASFDAASLAPGWRFELAFNPINTIRHLEDDDAVVEHLRRVGRCLAPGGAYAVGLSLSAYGLESPSEDVWTGARGGLRVRQVVQYEPADRRQRLEQVHSVLAVERPGGPAILPTTYTLRSYDLAQWRDVIARAGLVVDHLADEDGRPTQPREPGYALWVLRPVAGASGQGKSTA